MTLPMFLHRDKDLLLFIEEPELFLHPGYQRILIDTIFDETAVTGSRQVFVSTHSNHFLDITLDRDKVSVYRFSRLNEPDDEDEKKPRFGIENTTNEDFNLLAELGVRNSSVMLSNCTIWGEGITDRMYIRRYLQLYQQMLGDGEQRFEEDIHYSFVEYGGANITHWSFLDPEEGIDVQRLCGALMLIADKDSEKRIKRHEQLTKALGEQYVCLPCREIENLLTPEVIKALISEYESSEPDLRDFNQSAYRDKYLGRFIETKVFRDASASTRPSRSSHPYADNSGTVKDKLGFAKRALNHIKALADLSEDAVDLARRIHKFIKEQNS